MSILPSRRKKATLPPRHRQGARRWAHVRHQLDERKSVFSSIKKEKSYKTMMKELLNAFITEDGKLNQRKIKRLNAKQRKSIRIIEKEVEGKPQEHSWQSVRDDLFLTGTYLFDQLSPSPKVIGKFSPVLAVACWYSSPGSTFTCLGGTPCTSRDGYPECEEQQSIVRAKTQEKAVVLYLSKATDAYNAAAP